MRRMTALACLVVLLLGACASNPRNIEAAYVSPLKYRDYSCDDIVTEVGFIEDRTLEIYAQLKKNRRQDSAAAGFGLILFWPALFAIDGDGPQAYEFAQLKGEFQALSDSSIEKACDIDILLPGVLRAEKQDVERKNARNSACMKTSNRTLCRQEWERNHPM